MAAGVCSACQETPGKNVVAGKNEGIMEERIAKTNAQNTPYSMQNRMEVKDIASNNGRLVIRINADIENPATQYPVYEVAPLEAVSEELLNRCVNGYFGDAIIYEETPLTQSRLLEIITACKNNINLLETGSEDISNELKERMIHNINQKISQYELLLPSAPESVEAVPLNLQGGQAEIIGQVDIGLPEPAWFGLSNLSESVMLRFSNNEVGFNPNMQTMTEAKLETPLPNLLYTTAEQATGQAIELLERMDLAGDFTPFLTEIVQKRTQDNAQAEEIYAYCVSFTRVINQSVPVGELASWEDPQNAGGKAYSLPLNREKLYVYVDDTGVIQFDYLITSEISDTLNENVEIISFEEMEELIPKHLLNTFQWSLMPDDDSFKLIKEEISVDKIKLEYLIVPKKDDWDHCLLIPAWNVYGNTHSISQIKEEDGSWRDYDSDMDALWVAYQNDMYQRPLISINAIDGSMIYMN